MELLQNYIKILNKEKEPNFFNADLEGLIKEVEEILEACMLCERKCEVNRKKGEKGYCKAPNYLLISSEFLHFGEEFFLIPSHTIFLMGCNFSCIYCQNWEISHWYEKGINLSEKELARIIEIRKRQGAKNVNFVGGDPLPYLKNILEVLKILKENKVFIPVVWNSNFYHSKEVCKILNEVVDLFLPDFKYGENGCAKKLSGVENYFETITRNLKSIDFKKTDLCIRHLVLPSHQKCCSFKIVDWISENLDRFILNVMDQYRPCFNAFKDEKISRRLSKEEFELTLKYAKSKINREKLLI